VSLKDGMDRIISGMNGMAIDMSSGDKAKLSGNVADEGYGMIFKKPLKDKRLSIEAKAIYAFICSYTGAGQTAFPGVQLMLDCLGVSEKRFYKYRKQLIDLGYLTVTHRYDGQRNQSNLYTVNLSIDHTQFDTGHSDTSQFDSSHPDSGQNEGTKSNSLSSLTSFKSNTDTSSSSSIPDPFIEDMKKYGSVSQFYQENYHNFLSPINAQALDELVDKSSSDLVISAMKVALKEDNKRISYVEGIINKWLDANVTNLDEAREFQRKWQEKKGMTAGGKARTNVSDIRRYHGRSPEKNSYEQMLAESAAAKAVWK
jgi:DnaD/phage-associated family protein